MFLSQQNALNDVSDVNINFKPTLGKLKNVRHHGGNQMLVQRSANCATR